MQPGRLGIWMWRAATVVATLIALALALRVMQSERQPDLAPWHTWAPNEPRAADIDSFDWQGWLAAEERVITATREHLRTALADRERIPSNRYFEDSPVNPARFARDWNRSFVMLPEGAPAGAVVLVHGLSDSPYSLRHVARIYVERGFAAVSIRLPGHGTVPAGLARARWEDWRAATRLALREAARLAPGKPLHIVGYSNGAALTLQYVLDALDDASLAPVRQVVLFSPMIGITRYARYAGFAGWPAILPAFAKSAWLEIVPEFNPFKYSSFPVNAARQSYELTRQLDERLAAVAASGEAQRLPTIVAFQSVVDSTVVGDALFSRLFARLPENGSEIVLFDINRAAPLELLLSQSAVSRLSQMLPPDGQAYRITWLGNAPGQDVVAEHSRAPRSTQAEGRALALTYPREFFSLSHVALPFPPEDSLYGTQPEGDDFGIHLGNQALRGERGTLLDGADSLVRASCNPFFPYVAERLGQLIDAS